MGLTHFPHGILATPNIGAGGGAERLIHLWESDQIWYVDGDNGSASNAGNAPDASVALPSTAVSKASSYATIYIKPRTTSAAAQTYYYDNIVIPVTKSAISIIGAGNTMGAPMSCGSRASVQLRPLDISADMIDVNGPCVLLENMRITCTGSTASTTAVDALGGTTDKPDGLVVRGCMFENVGQTFGYGSAQGPCAIALQTTSYNTIENNIFRACMVGVGCHGTWNHTVIRGNMFCGAPGTRDADLWLNQNADAVNYANIIDNNIFADGLPAAASGVAKRFIYMQYVTAGTGIITNNVFACLSDEAQFNESGTHAVIADNMFCANNHVECTNAGPYGIITA